MASETSRIARALVAHRRESFASVHAREESRARAHAAIASVPLKRARLASAWRDDPAGLTLDVDFAPAPGVKRFLQASSVVLASLVASSAWAVMSAREDGVIAFLVPLATVLAVLGFPFVAVMMGSQREAEEARVATAIRRALTDEREYGAGRSR